MTDHQKETDEMRALMGTLPNMDLEPNTGILVGVEGINAEMIDAPINPYKTIYEVAVATWGDEEYKAKWEDTPPNARFDVVKAALTGQTLPQALEVCQFVFIIRGVSRAAFDQHARQRIGATFFSQGVRDNSRADSFFRMPTEFGFDYVEDGEELEMCERIIDWVRVGKRLYADILKKGAGSFQSARSILPMGTTHNYKYGANLAALKGYLAQRLQACEQEDTVYAAICVWNEINDVFPFLAAHLKPGCDYRGKCTYHQAYTLSEKFGCLFAGCGRWKDESEDYATFNQSCSDYETMAEQGGKSLPSPEEWPEFKDVMELQGLDFNLMRVGWYLEGNHWRKIPE